MTGHRLNRRQFLAASAPAMGALLAACGGGTIAAASRHPAGDARTDPIRLLSASTQVPRHETFIASLSDTANEMSDITVVNPFVTGTNRTGWQFAYEPLFYYNPWRTSKVSGPKWRPGKDGVIPYLATGYHYNSDYTAVTIKLRSGVTWSDGQPFTSKDVAFTLNMLRQNAPKLNYSFDIGRDVQKVETPDDHTVVLTLTTSNPRFVSHYLFWYEDVGFPIVPQHVWQGQDPLTFTNLDLNRGWPVVTGPWQLVASGAQQKIWDRRDNWWGAKTGFHALPAPRRVITLPLFEDSKLSELFLNNEIDSSHNMTPQDAQLALQRNPKLEVYSKKTGQWGWKDFWLQQLVFNCMTPPFDDPQIRWAVNYAINRKKLVEFAFVNQVPSAVLPLPTLEPIGKYFPPVDDLLKKHPIGETSTKKTAQIMQSKGYTKDSSGFWSKDGNRLSIVILYIQGFSYEESMIPILAQQLRSAGFDVSYKAPTNAGTLETLGQAQVWLQGDYGNADIDPYDELVTFHSRYAAPIGQTAQYPYRWVNHEFDSVIDKMEALSPTAPDYMKLYHQAMSIWIPELPMIPLVQNTLICPANTTYWKGAPNSEDPYCDYALWHRGAAGLVLNSLKSASKA